MQPIDRLILFPYYSVTESQAENRYYLMPHLSVITVSGEDAGVFLQGQLTCDINEITPDKASFAAFCNAKGRVISTLLVSKHHHDFQIILPTSLLDSVISKLQRYILRSKVRLVDCTERLAVIGLTADTPVAELALPEQAMAVSSMPVHAIRLRSATFRHLCLLDLHEQANFISELQQLRFHPGDQDDWRCMDIDAGIPWFDLPQTELYIPQMLSIDKLGGISFNKGCYTGQEIVARTHFLGQNKRELYRAVANTVLSDDCLQQSIVDAATGLKIGHVLAKQSWQGKSCLLLVLQTVAEPVKDPILDDAARTVLTLHPYQ